LGAAFQDTLLYSVAIVPSGPHLSVEARLTLSGPERITLSVPPGAPSSRVTVTGLVATDDRGRPLAVSQAGGTYTIDARDTRAVRFRYRASPNNRVAESSTGTGLDSTRLYAVTRSLFVAPDPLAYRKTSRRYPVIRVTVIPPPGWHVVTGWPEDRGAFAPASGDELLGSTLAAAPDFRRYEGTAGGVAWRLALRGHRYFPDSTLIWLIEESLRRGVEALGPLPGSRVTYTGELGRKGRVSGSLQGTASIGLVWEPSEVLEVPRGHDTFHETLHLWFGGAMEADRWWTEGVTDYFAARLYAEATERPEDLARLIWQSLRHYRAIPHATRLSMAEETRQRIGGDNTELLAYRKGMLAGMLLDAAIRRGSRGARRLDDAARALLALAATRPGRAVTGREMRDAVVRAGGATAERAWQRVVDGTAPLLTDEVAAALREVTGRELQPPPLASKRGKALRTPPLRR
jgi:predicted metalloprotease with PDZ domain